MQRWESFRGQFEGLGVRLVAISPDTVAEAAQMRKKYGLGMQLLSDESLKVTDLYHLRHEKALAGKRGPLRTLAIPTTFFVGADGLVKWIDQAEDYRVRSDADRVLAAVKQSMPVLDAGNVGGTITSEA